MIMKKVLFIVSIMLGVTSVFAQTKQKTVLNEMGYGVLEKMD